MLEESNATMTRRDGDEIQTRVFKEKRWEKSMMSAVPQETITKCTMRKGQVRERIGDYTAVSAPGDALDVKNGQINGNIRNAWSKEGNCSVKMVGRYTNNRALLRGYLAFASPIPTHVRS